MDSHSPSNFLLDLLETSGEGVIACDHIGQINFMNRKAREIFDRSDLLYQSNGNSPLSASELPLARALNEEKVCGQEILIIKKGAEPIFLLFNGHSIFNKEGKKTGAAVIFRDVTENRKNERRFQTIFDQTPISMQIFSPDGKTKMVNAAWKKLWNIPEDVIGNYILKVYNILEDPVLEEQGVLPYIKRGFAGELTVQPIIFYDPKKHHLEGTPRWVNAIISPLKDSTGRVNEVVLIHVDVTQEQRNNQAQEFLSQISSLLISTLDYEHLIEQLAQTVVNTFAEACIIDLIEGNEVKRLVTKHRNPAKHEIMDLLHTKYPPALDSPQPTMVAIRTKEPQLFAKINQDLVLQYTKDAEHAELVRKMGLKSGIAVPLKRGGRIIGAISLMITDGEHEYDEFDVKTAQTLGQKASMAIENAQLYTDVKNALRQRDEFISIVSHELKTPITSLKLQIQVASRMTAKSGAPSVDAGYVKKLTETSNRQLDRLTRLVEDMLDISRIASGRLGIKPIRVNFSELTREVLENFKDQFHELGIETCFSIEENLYYTCDPFRMEQVITNLLNNAIRYGEQKPVNVTLTKEGKRFLLTVEDHGRGIPHEDLGRIFNQFERSHATNDVRGLGLGLYITRQILLAHDEEIHVKSEMEKGTIFIVELKNI